MVFFAIPLEKKDIKVNGKELQTRILLFLMEMKFWFYISDELLNTKSSSVGLEIIYEDDNILVINKPSNIEVTGNNSLTDLVHKHYETSFFKPMPCHRLDRNTTGLILYAKAKVL